MFSFFGQQAPLDSGSSSDDESADKNLPADMSLLVNNNVSRRDEISVRREEDQNGTKTAAEVGVIVPTENNGDSSSSMEERNLSLKLKVMEEQNKKMTKQLSALQSIITSKSSLYLEFKQKFEVSIKTQVPRECWLK